MVGLRRAITEVQNNNAATLRFEELYRQGYTLVLHKYGDLLYDGVTEVVKEKMLITARNIAGTTEDLESFLALLGAEWERHKMIMVIIKDIFMYMDKTYCRNQKKTTVYDMGVTMFRDLVLKQVQIQPVLQKALLDAVEKERHGECIDRQMMKHTLRMLVDCNVQHRGFYEEEFENEFLKSTRDFYKQESQAFLAINTVPDFLKKIEARIAEEEFRADVYIEYNTKKRLCQVIDNEFILTYSMLLIEHATSGVRVLIKENMIEDLSRMYRIFSRQPTTLDQLRLFMSGMIKEMGTAIVQDQENIKDPMKFVQNVLELRAKFSHIVDNAFIDLRAPLAAQADRLFTKSLKESFESFLNRDSRAAQYLSAFTDDLLRKSLKGVPENEVEEKLDQIIVIFRYLSDKDVFEDFYKKHLAQRLLLGRRISDDIEKQMISKLKSECGQQYTIKLENMFKDMILSEQVMTSFSQHVDSALNNSGSSFLQLSVNVLTTGCWPIAPTQPCHLPLFVMEAAERFKSFYISKYSGRRLSWLTSQGSSELKCSFAQGKKEFIVSSYHMCILYLFNQKNSFSYLEMKELTSIPEVDLKRHLLSLAHPKVKVLTKIPNTKEVQDDHQFAWNENYANPLYRVKINLLSIEGDEKAPAVDAAPEMPETVQHSRQHSVEAAIVRVMKARKTLEHNQLIIEVTKQLSNRFSLDANFAKKVIEQLIEREYLEREEGNRRIYKYLA